MAVDILESTCVISMHFRYRYNIVEGIIIIINSIGSGKIFVLVSNGSRSRNLREKLESYNILSEYIDLDANPHTGTQGCDNYSSFREKIVNSTPSAWDIEQTLVSCAKKTEQSQKIVKRLIVFPVAAFISYIFDNNSALSF